jgi:DNA-3-methyladenine glycosylase II
MSRRHDDAIAHLRKRDRVLRKVIKAAGPCTLKPARDRFWMLVCSILSQQLSTKSAETIRNRVDGVLSARTPEAIAKLSDAELRGCGVSPQKLGYLRHLCNSVLDGRVDLKKISRKPDADVIEELVQIKGIGVWTAHMFMMFSLGRPDVFPVGDLGIKVAIRDLYEFSEMPTDDEAHEIAAPWRPYATVASWYCWRSLDLKKLAKAAAKA